MNKYDKTLSVGLYLGDLRLPIDPLNNPSLSNAFFSNNMYSNLIEVDQNNKYILELASNYYFSEADKTLTFEFVNSRVNAEDTEFSLKRLIFQNQHLHADFWNIICAPDESVEKCSERIYINLDKLIIKYHDDEKSKYIIPTLASVDFKIVPKAAFNSFEYKSAQISRYDITSGYYHLAEKAILLIMSLFVMNTFEKIFIKNLS